MIGLTESVVYVCQTGMRVVDLFVGEGLSTFFLFCLTKIPDQAPRRMLLSRFARSKYVLECGILNIVWPR